MKRIGRVLKRTLKADFEKLKESFPKSLSFLSSIPFYAVTECLSPDSGSRQTRVEIIPANLKKISDSYEKYKKLRKEHKKVLSILENAKTIFIEQHKYIEALEKANNQLMENLGQGPETPASDVKSYFQVAEEIGFIPRGLPLQGGLPSLGKKR